MQRFSGNLLPDRVAKSFGDVSCTAHAARHVCLQILFKRPMPAIVWEPAAKPTPLAHTKQHLNVQVAETCGVFTILTSTCVAATGVNFLSISDIQE